MKRIHQILTATYLCVTLFVASGCNTDSNMPGTDGSVFGNRLPLTIHVTASSFEELPETPGASRSTTSSTSTTTAIRTASTRTPVEDGITTKFNAGDAIGLFVIKNGAIVDGVNNAKLTYLPGTTAGTGTWKPAADAKKPYYYSGETSLTYIAYYPYKDGITITPSQTTDEIIASLSANTKLQPSTDQSATDGSAYTASDLMTASATSADITTDASGNPSLNFKFTHQFSLLVLVPRKLSEYVAPAGKTYTYWAERDYDASNVTLNGITAYRMADGTFRAIVKPTITSSALKGNYKDVEGRIVNYQGDSYDDGFAAGGCYELTVARPQPGVTQERAVAVGDFYMQDGRIVVGSKETLAAEEQANCIGIVFKVGAGNQDNISNYDGKLTAIHGYVMSLDQVSRTWGDKSKGWTGTSWYEYWAYPYTKLLLEGMAQGYSFPGCKWCVEYTPVPTGVTSGWHFPSYNPVIDFVDNATKLNTYLSKVGGTSISGSYLTATESSDRANAFLMRKTGATGNYKADKSGNYYVRAILTF